MAPGINSLTYAMFAIASDVMNPQQTAAAIRQLRARLNLSQEEMAARLNVAYAMMNGGEAGKSKPQRAQRDAIEALASGIGVEESFASDARPEAVATSGRRRRGVSHSPVLGTKSMEQMLWDAACQVRGEKDAPKFKAYLLPLLFIKRLSDVFAAEVQRQTETSGDRATTLAVTAADPPLVPP